MNIDELNQRLDAGDKDFSYEQVQKLDLNWRDLHDVSFEGADLSGANLSNCNLSQANLQNANLSFANLSGANLTEANIKGAILEGAILSQVNWADVEFDHNTQLPFGVTASSIQNAQKKSAAPRPLESPSPAKPKTPDIPKPQKKPTPSTSSAPLSFQLLKNFPVSSETLESLNPQSLIKKVQDLKPENLVEQVQGAVSQAAQNLKTSAQDLLQSQNPSTAPPPPPQVPPPFSPPHQSIWKEIDSIKTTGHSNLVFSTDGKYLAIAQANSHLDVWYISTPSVKHFYTFLGQQKGVYGIAFSPENHWIASGAGDGKITLWQLKNKALLKTLIPSNFQMGEANFNQQLFKTYHPDSFSVDGIKAAVSAITFCPKGQHLLAGYANGMFRRWDLSSGRLLKEQKLHDGPITQVKLSGNGKLLMTSSMDHTLKLWHPELLSCFHEQNFEAAWPSDCVITPDHQFAIAALINGTIQSWNLSKNRQQYQISEAHSPGLLTLCLVSSSTLISVGQDNRLKHWDLQTGNRLASQESAYPASLCSGAKTLAVTGGKNIVHLLQKIP